jgi:RNA polymerase sigma factor (sigma-70 family)
MRNGPVSVVLRQLSRIAAERAPAANADGELMARFLSRRDDEAFAVLMRRHGPMVLGVCRRVLGHTQDAEDSFQATFMLLAQRAGSIRKRDSLSSWLHGVAYRLSARARTRRQSRPVSTYSAPLTDVTEPGAAAAWRELQALLDEEIQRLPDVCRSALVLCYFEGASHEEAAARLGWPVGSVKSRLNRARQLLRDRLARRGIGLSVAALGAFLAADGAAAQLPSSSSGATLTAARRLLEDGLLGGLVAENVIDLVKNGGAGALPSRGGSILAAVGAMMILIGGGSFAAWQLASAMPAAVGQNKPQDAPQPAVQAAGNGARADRYGDPLPVGAIVRFGSVRLRHGINLASVAFSPTENVIVSGGKGPWLIFWNAVTGKELRRHKGSTDYYSEIVFSPNGAMLAANEGDDVVVRDAKAGQELHRLRGHKGPIGSISWSARGDRLASTARDRTIRLWDPLTGKELLRIDDAHEQDAHSVALAPDGSFILSASYDKAAKLWDAATGKERRRFTIGEGAISTLTLSHDGTVLALADERGGRLWDVATGKELRKLEGEARGGHFAFGPGDKTVAHGGRDGFVRIYETATGRKLHEFRAHPESINAVSFSRDGKSLVTGYADSTIHIWDATTGKQKVVLDGHQERLVTAAWSPDGRRVATAGWDRTVRVWDPITGKLGRKLRSG